MYELTAKQAKSLAKVSRLVKCLPNKRFEADVQKQRAAQAFRWAAQTTMRIPRFVAFGAFLLFGCDASSEPQLEIGSPRSGNQHKAAKPPIEAQETFDQELLLIDRVPLGFSYNQVKAVFPEIGELRSDPGGWGFGSWGLTEAVVESKALGRPAKLEFNFKSGRLYGYFTCLERLDLETANQTYEQIKRYYTHRFGAAYEEREKESEYASVSSYWYTKAFDLNLANNIHKNIRSDLCWGFQIPTKANELNNPPNNRLQRTVRDAARR